MTASFCEAAGILKEGFSFQAGAGERRFQSGFIL